MSDNVERLPLAVVKNKDTLSKAKRRAKARIWREQYIASLLTDASAIAQQISDMSETLAEYKVVFNRSVIRDAGSLELKKILTREGSEKTLRHLSEIECAVRDMRFRILGEAEAPE